MVAAFLLGITQLEAIKRLPYLVSNVMSLGTCFLLALVVLILGKRFPGLLESRLFAYSGTMAFELYLVHAFTLSMIKSNVVSLVHFIGATIIGAYLLHRLMKGKAFYGKSNSCHPNKE